MTIKVSCQCGAKFSAKPELAGKRVKCSKCGQALVVPQLPPADSEHVTCECGKSYKVAANLAGKSVRCKACGRHFMIPATIGQIPIEAMPIEAEPVDSFGSSSFGNPSDFGNANNFAGSSPSVWDNLPSSTPLTQSLPMPTSTMSIRPLAPAVAQPAPESREKKDKKQAMVLALGLGGLIFVGVMIVCGIKLVLGSFTGVAKKTIVVSHESPESVYEAYESAMLNGDWRTTYQISTPESRQAIVGFAVISAAASVEFDSDVKRILKKHGIDPNAYKNPDSSQTDDSEDPQKLVKLARDAAATVKDPQAFYFDLMEYYDDYEDEDFGFSLFDLGAEMYLNDLGMDTKLKDLTITGDKATGIMSTSFGDETIDQPIEFRKIENKWYVEMPYFEGGF